MPAIRLACRVGNVFRTSAGNVGRVEHFERVTLRLFPIAAVESDRGRGEVAWIAQQIQAEQIVATSAIERQPFQRNRVAAGESDDQLVVSRAAIDRQVVQVACGHIKHRSRVVSDDQPSVHNGDRDVSCRSELRSLVEGQYNVVIVRPVSVADAERLSVDQDRIPFRQTAERSVDGGCGFDILDQDDRVPRPGVGKSGRRDIERRVV